MQVIPVIDLLNGLVVHAQQGQRADYAPVRSQLTSDSDLFAIVEALLTVYPFKTFYIADLNSIQQKQCDASHRALIEKLCNQYPDISFWVDAGVHSTETMQPWKHLPITPVIGTENCSSLHEYQAMIKDLTKSPILSLDYFGQTLKGNAELISNAGYWPKKVIVMTLAQVGSGLGPDFEKLLQIKEQKANGQIYAAGGVRNVADLIALKQHRIHGALVATALHNKQISRQDLLKLNEQRPV